MRMRRTIIIIFRRNEALDKDKNNRRRKIQLIKESSLKIYNVGNESFVRVFYWNSTIVKEAVIVCMRKNI